MKDLMKEDLENQILIKCQTGMKDSFLMKITKQKVEKVK